MGGFIPKSESITGTFYPPTVLIDVPENAIIAQEEIFGPIMCVFRVKVHFCHLILCKILLASMLYFVCFVMLIAIKLCLCVIFIFFSDIGRYYTSTILTTRQSEWPTTATLPYPLVHSQGPPRGLEQSPVVFMQVCLQSMIWRDALTWASLCPSVDTKRVGECFFLCLSFFVSLLPYLFPHRNHTNENSCHSSQCLLTIMNILFICKCFNITLINF